MSDYGAIDTLCRLEFTFECEGNHPKDAPFNLYIGWRANGFVKDILPLQGPVADILRYKILRPHYYTLNKTNSQF